MPCLIALFFFVPSSDLTWYYILCAYTYTGLQKLEEFRRNKNKYVTPVKKRDRKQRTPASSSIRKVKEEKEKERVHVSSSSSSSSASSSLLSSVNGTSFQSPSVKSDRRHRRISNTDSTHESSTSAATTASAALSPADLDAAVFPSSASSSVISPVKLSVSTCLDEDADPTNHTTSSTMDSSDGKTINNNDDGSGTHTRYASSVSSPDDATAHGSKSARLNVDVDASSRHMDVFGKGNGILSAPSVDRVFSFSSSAVGASVQQQQNSGNIYTMGNQGNSDGRSDTSTSTNTNTNTNSNDNDHHDITLLPETPTTPSLSASTPLSSTSSTTTASTASSASAIPSGMKLVDAQYLVDMKEYISSQAREIERLNSVDREVSTYKLEIQELTLNNTGLVDEKATLLGDIEVLTVRCQALTAEKEELGQMTATIGRLAKESDELRSERDRLNKVSQSLQDALRSQGALHSMRTAYIHMYNMHLYPWVITGTLYVHGWVHVA